jgi:hypothetical protein
MNTRRDLGFIRAQTAGVIECLLGTLGEKGQFLIAVGHGLG